MAAPNNSPSYNCLASAWDSYERIPRCQIRLSEATVLHPAVD